MPHLNCIPSDQHDQDWALLRGMVITVIDEVKNSDASTGVNNSIEDVNDFLVTGSATAAVNTRILSTSASRCCASFPLVWCVGKACTCYFCNFSSSRALVLTSRASAAQLVRARDCQSLGRRFDSG